MRRAGIKSKNILIMMLSSGIVVGIIFSYFVSVFVEIKPQNIIVYRLSYIIAGIIVALWNFFIISGIINKLNHIENKTLEYKDKVYRDELTGVYNRRAFNKDMEDISKQDGEIPLSIAFLDIDNFRLFNNKYGHTMGDSVLKIVAKELKECVRASDRIYRYGGEEFVIVLKYTGKDMAKALAERIRQRINNLTLETGDHISVSIGIATCPDDARKVHELINNSDMALYWAKNSGKNVVGMFSNLTE